MDSKSDRITPERWQEIDTVFQAVVGLAPDECAEYLDRVCDRDRLLREKIETMLAADRRGWELVEKSALEAAAVLFSDDQPQLSPGQTFSHYEIERLIGKGGMGEVYLAADKLLNRKIALKLLPADYTRDRERLMRFHQEAQAASALNHPNILTIHELREADGQQFIATEFVDGETLRQRLKRGPLSQAEAVEIAIEIANALSAAHQAGIVHRDIKPENVMLRPDGYVKVLDFGLAKLTEHPDTKVRRGAVDDVSISSGLLFGTVRYMSPEQARGEKVDRRSDIFSLGVVLYEMIAGCSPYKGKTTNDLFAEIRDAEPEPLINASDELQDVVSYALRKRTDERYQTVENLLADLRNVKEKTQLDAKLQPSAPNGRPEMVATGNVKFQSTTFTGEHDSRDTAPSIEYFIAGVKQHKAAATLAILTFAIAAVAVGFTLYRRVNNHRAVAPFQNVNITRLTSSGHAIRPAISPDGNFVFYGKTEDDKVSLWLREIRTNSEIQIVQSVAGQLGGGPFSRDGNSVYYSMKTDVAPGYDVYQVSVAGGPPKKILAGVTGIVGLSPDGKHLAFVRGYYTFGESTLSIANSDGSGEHTILKRRAPDAVIGTPAWSPDSAWIACITFSTTQPIKRNIIEVNAGDGSEKPISTQWWESIGAMVWLPQGRGLLVIGGDWEDHDQIWHISEPSGEARRLTNEIGGYSTISVTADGKTLISELTEKQSRIWTAQVDPTNSYRIDLDHARQLSESRFDGRHGLCFTPGGQIVFNSDESGTTGLWIMDPDGKNRHQLTQIGGQCKVSADGNLIVFTSWSGQSDDAHIFRMNIDGGELKQLTFGHIENYPSLSSDSRSVFYSAHESAMPTISRVSIDGGTPIQITDRQARGPNVSPDGSLIAYGYWSEKKEPRIAIISSGGGEPLKTIGLRSGFLAISWAPDGKGLSLIYPENNGPGNLWYQPVDGGPARQLTNFTNDKLIDDAWSVDGTKLAFVRSREVTDVVLINDLR